MFVIKIVSNISFGAKIISSLVPKRISFPKTTPVTK